jgi:hypothetical protein
MLTPRSRPGWIALLVIVALAAVVGSVVSPTSGALGFALLSFFVGSILVRMTEAWRADIWKTSRPPNPIRPTQVPDYLLWLLRHRSRAK